MKRHNKDYFLEKDALLFEIQKFNMHYTNTKPFLIFLLESIGKDQVGYDYRFEASYLFRKELFSKNFEFYV